MPLLAPVMSATLFSRRMVFPLELLIID